MGRKVLLIIDLQAGFVAKGMDKVVKYVQSLVQSKGWDVIIQTRWENYMGSQYEERLGYNAVGNSKETKMVLDNVTDHIITRTCYTCWGEKLERLIRKDDEIHVVGLETDACVMATLFSLWDNGYHFKVHSSGVATPDKALQAAALKMIVRQFGKDSLI